MWKFALAVVVSGAAGFALGRGTTASDDVPATSTASEEVAASEPAIADTIDALPLAEPGTEVLDGHLFAEPLRGDQGPGRLFLLAELVRQGVASPNVGVFEYASDPPTLTDGFVSMFFLTASERDELERSAREARDASIQLQLKRAKSAQAEDGSWVIEIPAFPEEGGRVHDKAMAEFARVLGPTRNQTFLDWFGDRSDNMFGNLGTGDRRIVVEPMSEHTAGRKVYKYTDHNMSIHGRVSASGQGGRDAVEGQYGELAKRLIPPEYWED